MDNYERLHYRLLDCFIPAREQTIAYEKYSWVINHTILRVSGMKQLQCKRFYILYVCKNSLDRE